MLGSKTLGLNVLELQFVIWQTMIKTFLSLFGLAQSVFICKVRIECSTGFTVYIAWLEN